MGDLNREYEVMRAVVEKQERDAALYALLDNYTTLAHDVLGLAVEEHVPGVPWFPFDEEKWPYRLMAEHLERDNGKDKGLFCTRGTGKSVLSLMLQSKLILKDHNHTLRIGSEAKTEVVKRSIWVRDQLTRLEPEYGPFRGSGEWGKDRFTVIRSGGGVLDETVTLTSPDSPGTGAHPRAFLIDDGVGDISEQSQAKMTAGVDWYKRLGSQELEGTTTWVVGTFRLGWNIYRYIIERIEGGLHLVRVARGCYLHEGKTFDILVCHDIDENGEPVFPFQSKKYLETKKKRIGETQYKTQFSLLLPGAEDTTFNADSVKWNEPPENVALRTYILTDTATSTGKARHTSMSAMIAVSKTPDNQAYVREMKMGKIAPERVPGIILDLWKEWGAEKIVYEAAPGAQAYMSGVRAEAKARAIPVDIIHKMFKELPRPADKYYRIQSYLAPHTDMGHLHFCKGVKKDILRVNEDGRLEGLLGREFGTYFYGADGSWDGLDVLADIWGEDKYSAEIFKPPLASKKIVRNELWHEYAARITRERFGPEGVF